MTTYDRARLLFGNGTPETVTGIKVFKDGVEITPKQLNDQHGFPIFIVPWKATDKQIQVQVPGMREKITLNPTDKRQLYGVTVMANRLLIDYHLLLPTDDERTGGSTSTTETQRSCKLLARHVLFFISVWLATTTLIVANFIWFAPRAQKRRKWAFSLLLPLAAMALLLIHTMASRSMNGEIAFVLLQTAVLAWCITIFQSLCPPRRVRRVWIMIFAYLILPSIVSITLTALLRRYGNSPRP
ncbi:hypothetical protein EBZ80_17795 [bacterium]|nr:hypothetical protein [bacterium]